MFRTLLAKTFTTFSLGCIYGISWSEELRLCGVHWPPFSYSENERLVSGISVDINTEAFRRLGIKFTADDLPWPRCLDGVERGEYDAIIDNASRPNYVHGTNATSVYPLTIYVREDYPHREFTWESMNGKTVGVVRGYWYTESIRNFNGWFIDKSVTDEIVLRKLAGGRYDYAVSDIFVAPILAEKLGIKIKALAPLIDSSQLYLGFKEKHSKIAAKYDLTIKQMILDGTMDRIYLKYLPYSYKAIFEKYKNDDSDKTTN